MTAVKEFCAQFHRQTGVAWRKVRQNSAPYAVSCLGDHYAFAIRSQVFRRSQSRNAGPDDNYIRVEGIHSNSVTGTQRWNQTDWPNALVLFCRWDCCWEPYALALHS